MTSGGGSPVVWRRNLVGVAVAAAAAAVIVATELYPDWSTYRDTVVPGHTVASGKSLDAYGQTWQLGSIQHLDALPSGALPHQLPKGTTLLVVTIDRSGSPTLGYCVGYATDGTHRWRAQGIGQFAVPTPDGATLLCSDPGRLQFSFLLPDAAVPTAVDVVDGEGRIRLRFTL